MPAFSELFSDPMAAIGYGLLTSGQNPVGAAMGVMQQAEQSKLAQEDAEFRKLMMQYKMEQAQQPKLTVANDAEGRPVIVDKRAGTYALAQQAGMPPMMQPAAPYQPIQSRELPPMGSQYDADLGAPPRAPAGNMDDLVRQQLESGGFAPPGGFNAGGSPNMPMPPEPTSVPLPQPLPPQMTPIPKPVVQPGTRSESKLKEAEIDLWKQGNEPLSPEAQIKLNNARKAEFKQTTASLNALEENVAATKAAIKNSLAALDAGGGGNQYALGSWIPNSSPGAVAANLQTIKSDAITSSLSQMREASKTGGAVGSLSGTEGIWLGATKGAIDPSQEASYRETLLRRDAALDKVLLNARQYYKDNYGALIPPQEAQPYTPQALSAPATGQHRYKVIK